MKLDEALGSGVNRQSFSCVPLRDVHDSPVGIYYMDATAPDAFADGVDTVRRLHEFIVERCQYRGIIDALGHINQELRRVTPLLRIHS
jgi:hypothetical protein